jgi:acetyl-CoA carboxylase carboxyl transferase subunit alpha
MEYTLDFERPVLILENQIKELQSSGGELDIDNEVKALQEKLDRLIRQVYENLTPWQRVQLSRHPQRPHTIDYINNLIDDFHPLAGDRNFRDDKAMLGGLGFIGDEKVMIIGIEKGRKTGEKIEHNFGMPKPEGYRKALRLMELAEQFNLPIITLVDTPGAYPGIGAEERGQAQAIANNIEKMFEINSPILTCIIGEGGSGGALGIAVADYVCMLEYSTYSVISPESCASILWSDPSMAEKAANSLQLTPKKAMELGIIDKIIQEPFGGAHRHPKDTIKGVKESLLKRLKELKKEKIEDVKAKRFKKFREMGINTLIQSQ